MTKEELSEKRKQAIKSLNDVGAILGLDEMYIDELEKENKQLKSELTKKADTNHSLVEQMADLESENAELKETLGKCAKMPVLYCLGAKETITKAKEIIKRYVNWDYGDKSICLPDITKQAEQFLKEIEK